MTKNPAMRFLALGMTAVFMSGCATTDTTDDKYSDESYQENRGVSVVGSRIKRDSEIDERASPARVYDRDDMRATGAHTAGEFLGGRY